MILSMRATAHILLFFAVLGILVAPVRAVMPCPMQQANSGQSEATASSDLCCQSESRAPFEESNDIPDPCKTNGKCCCVAVMTFEMIEVSEPSELPDPEQPHVYRMIAASDLQPPSPPPQA